MLGRLWTHKGQQDEHVDECVEADKADESGPLLAHFAGCRAPDRQTAAFLHLSILSVTSKNPHPERPCLTYIYGRPYVSSLTDPEEHRIGMNHVDLWPAELF